MHSVCLTSAFERAARAAGMTESEINALVDYLAENPAAGEEMKGTGGCRKLRVAGRGKGKSGGYRTITFYSGEAVPVFLITVFSKGERASLTAGERNKLKAMAAVLVDEYKQRVTKVGEDR
ncbi:type II toxin-antitoxin system RelE/ParE family toxin [Aurantimonas sp. HBX-1]|uniref:type II toxin-antitoxin system RelE/ParE family toxin n=1 Tax=Aurantimonas sp. HBX-1 TaxID=2906072 RepID=UPI002106B5EF|nr:type II toxin-antitoxin system RelE/ParE family toxin [Aurantimonas sp. HBX-1]